MLTDNEKEEFRVLLPAITKLLDDFRASDEAGYAALLSVIVSQMMARNVSKIEILKWLTTNAELLTDGQPGRNN